MKRAVLLTSLLAVLLACSTASAWATPLAIKITPDPTRVATVLGGRFTIRTQVANTGTAPTGDVLAHLNVASMQDDVYVDPEDWSSSRSQSLILRPGESRTLSWDIQAVNAGRFAAYVVVLPEGADVGGAEGLVVSPLVKIDVETRSALSESGVLPVVLVIPLLLGLSAVGLRLRRR
jgi:uncharacterized membrane protein